MCMCRLVTWTLLFVAGLGFLVGPRALGTTMGRRGIGAGAPAFLLASAAFCAALSPGPEVTPPTVNCKYVRFTVRIWSPCAECISIPAYNCQKKDIGTRYYSVSASFWVPQCQKVIYTNINTKKPGRNPWRLGFAAPFYELTIPWNSMAVAAIGRAREGGGGGAVAPPPWLSTTLHPIVKLGAYFIPFSCIWQHLNFSMQ